jgi:glycosyltransferase involved in cell wall biosynthesis
MKIGYILPTFTIVSGSSGGIKVQADHWGSEMIKRGHEVVEISVWSDYDWKSFDIIHFFYLGFSYAAIYQNLKPKCPQAKFVCSPIIDTYIPTFFYKIIASVKIPKLKIWSEFALLKHYRDLFDLFLVRSNHEKKYLTKGMGVPLAKIKTILLDYRLNEFDKTIEKEDFCLHVSRISDKTKNVERLVKAALKYKFPLKLVGTSTDEFNNKLLQLIGKANNIEILGRVSDSELISLYNRAKVFALPSIREGVGLVALEAAVHGCDIVITSIGGPKEYFAPNAFVVNPFNINQIGMSIVKAIEGKSYQPALRNLILSHNNTEHLLDVLESAYKEVLV